LTVVAGAFPGWLKKALLISSLVPFFFGAEPASGSEQPERQVSPRRNPATKSPLNMGLILLIKKISSPNRIALGSGRPALLRIALT
jgi:hypothetical protein